VKYATVITVTGRNTAVYDIPSTGRDPAANQPSQQYVNEKFELKQLMVCLFELFDKLVLPILCGWKISGTLAVRDEIEKVHRKFCKYVLCFISNTPRVLRKCRRLIVNSLYA